jgi:hypothetical protein
MVDCYMCELHINFSYTDQHEVWYRLWEIRILPIPAAVKHEFMVSTVFYFLPSKFSYVIYTYIVSYN